MYFSPDGRSAALFGFENAIEMSARREATFCRNDIVAVVGTFCHHLLGCIESYLAEPYSEGGFQALVEVDTQFVFEMWSVFDSVSILAALSL